MNTIFSNTYRKAVEKRFYIDRVYTGDDNSWRKGIEFQGDVQHIGNVTNINVNEETWVLNVSGYGKMPVNELTEPAALALKKMMDDTMLYFDLVDKMLQSELECAYGAIPLEEAGIKSRTTYIKTAQFFFRLPENENRNRDASEKEYERICKLLQDKFNSIGISLTHYITAAATGVTIVLDKFHPEYKKLSTLQKIFRKNRLSESPIPEDTNWMPKLSEQTIPQLPGSKTPKLDKLLLTMWKTRGVDLSTIEEIRKTATGYSYVTRGAVSDEHKLSYISVFEYQIEN